MNSLITNGSFLLLMFIALTVGVLLMTGKIRLRPVKKTGQREYGPLLWPCPNCKAKVHKNMILDHMCEV